MFAERGFAAVRMEDIAQAVGVTPRALYRHYPGKQALLFSVAQRSQDGYLGAIDAERSGLDDDRRYRAVITDLAAVTLGARSHAVLWQREARHLDSGQRAVLRERLDRIIRGVAELLVTRESGRRAYAERPLPRSEEITTLLSWAVVSVLTSPGHHGRSLPRPESDQLLADVASALADSDPSSGTTGPPIGADPGTPQLGTRRERILYEAAELFNARGYGAVSLEQVGESVGILGPSVYHYFASKQALLIALITRVNEWLTWMLLSAKADSGSPAEAVAAMTRSYVHFALRYPSLIGTVFTESIYTAGPEAEGALRIRNEIIEEWAELVGGARPELVPQVAVVLTETVIALVDDLARTRHLRAIHSADEFVSLADTVFAVRKPE